MRRERMKLSLLSAGVVFFIYFLLFYPYTFVLHGGFGNGAMEDNVFYGYLIFQFILYHLLVAGLTYMFVAITKKVESINNIKRLEILMVLLGVLSAVSLFYILTPLFFSFFVSLRIKNKYRTWKYRTEWIFSRLPFYFVIIGLIIARVVPIL
ncbi:hypothetical protein CN918_31040 [Priestia megaterium]|nr:hypothetical protein CN918_31040 [Priestia megaterium]